MLNRNVLTIAGLVIAYLSIAGISFLFRMVFGNPLNDRQVISREAMIFLMAGLLLWIIRQEKLSLSSIGLYPQKVRQSILWAVVTVCVSFGLLFGCLLLFQQIGWTYGDSKSSFTLSIWTTLLVVLRAGVVEELFFRGYIIEQLTMLINNRYSAAFGSLIPFALLHYSQGMPGMVLALILGGVLTGVYLWRKDLKSTMMAHFLIDFIPNVLGEL